MEVPVVKRGRILFWSGLGIMVGGLAIAVQIPFFYLRSHVQGEHLLNQAKNMLATPLSPDGGGQSGPATAQNVGLANTWTLGTVQPDTLVGGIRIPAIHVEAPMLQGTDDAELDVGAGHLTTSVWPGENGTSVIAAHNATWFRHVDKLKPGDLVQVWTKAGFVTFAVTKSEVVQTGTPVSDTATPSLVLEACYPLDALYLTPYRYLVSAKWVKTDKTGGPSNPSLNAQGVLYHGEVPQDLLREGVTLSANSLPMGSLQFTGTPTADYTQSQSPLSASSTLVQLYLAWVHASVDKSQPDLGALGATPANNPLWGATLSGISYDSRFDVTLDVAGDQLRTATGSTIFVVSSKRYQVTVKAAVDANEVMRMTSLTVVPL
jgi:sortase A